VLTTPGPYAAWVSWLDAFARGEDLPNQHLCAVDEQLGPHMQQRLLRRVAAAFEARARVWNETLGRHLAASVAREPAELGALLVAARSRLQPLRELTTESRLPAEVRQRLSDALSEMIKGSQQNLEHSVRRAPQGAERLLAVARENSLAGALTSPRMPAHRTQPPPPAAGRRVIL
jgi:hypothetical protein